MISLNNNICKLSILYSFILLLSCKGSPEPEVSVEQTYIVINEKESLDFTLDITANVSLVFDLPVWIREKTAAGGKTYSFQADPLPDGVDSRTGNLLIKYAGKSITVPVKQIRDVCMLRVATYNVYYTDWQSRATMVNNLIRQYDFDIFGVQEAYYNPHLIDLTGDGVYAYTGQGRDGGTNNEHSAILYKKARFELLSSGDFWFSTTPDKASVGWDAELRRICSWGKFREKDSKREFYFFNSHFDHKGENARSESARLLLDKIKTIAGNNMPVFATGDYNAEPHWPEIQTLQNDGLLKDAYFQTEKTPYGTFETAHGFNPPNPSSSHRIDYIFVTKDIRIKEYGVLNDRPNGQYPSDHDPVLVVAEF